MLKTCQELMSSLHLSGYLEMNYQFKTNKNNHLMVCVKKEILPFRLSLHHLLSNHGFLSRP